MDRKEEYHDPDYPGTSGDVKNEPTSLSEDEKVEKIKRVICREFTNELDIRENELMLIDQRMSTSRRMLHRLRYALVSGYYRDQKLQLTNSHIQDEVAAQSEPRARAEVTSLLRDGQRRLHPSVRKLLGKQSVDLAEILMRSRAPRSKSRKDYSAMVRCKNYTIPADTTKSLRPDSEVYSDVIKLEASSSRPKRQPRQFDPKITNVVTLDEATRNQMKYRYRIIIGNTSKYAPPASRADRSTHKWLLYVRGPPHAPDVSPLVTAVTVRLHHSYAPHHTVHIDKPPFHMSRRGWGEFPAKVELHFALAERNRPATVEHTIKLDRNYTGLQTLGAETVVDVWLYSTQEMLIHEYKEDIYEDQSLDTLPDIPPDVPSDLTPDLAKLESVEPIEPEPGNDIESVSNGQTDSWLDFFSKDTTELDVDEMIIKPVKKVEEKINDLESLIETNVISKDVAKEDVKTEMDSECVAEEQTVETVNDVEENQITYKSVELQEDLPNELLSQPTSPRKRIMKYMDPTTGRIYYLELDRNLDLSKVQEIVINSKGNIKTAKISPIKPNGLKNVRRNAKKGGVSLLKPEVKSYLKTENNSTKTDKQKPTLKRNYTHIENDHCYLGSAWSKSVNFTTNLKQNSSFPETIQSMDNIDDSVVVKKEQSVYECLCGSLSRFSCVRIAVNYLLKKMPLMTEQARDPDYVKNFPYVVETEERYWKFDFAKRRNIEWSRAKLINRLLTDHLNNHTEPIWRTKQILIYSRMHGFYPVRPETMSIPFESRTENEWSSWTDLENRRRSESSIKELYPKASDICSLTVFDSSEYTDLSDSVEAAESDEELEVVNEVPVKIKKEIVESSSNLTLLPVESEEDRLRFLFIERKSADIGVELRNEDVGSGYCYSAVHAVMLSAVQSFAEDLIRSALAAKLSEPLGPGAAPLGPGAAPHVWMGSPPSRAALSPAHVYRGARAPRLRVLRARDLALEPPI